MSVEDTARLKPKKYYKFNYKVNYSAVKMHIFKSYFKVHIEQKQKNV